MSTLSVSHTDLDGIGCQIALRQVFGDITRMNISYNKIDEYIEIIEDYCSHQKPTRVFITDLSFTFEQLQKINYLAKNNPNVHFYFIDHHPFKEDYKHLSLDNLTILISSKASATKLTYLYLKNNYNPKSSKDLEDFVNYINAYDIWLQDTPEFKVGFVLNEIFWQYKIPHFWGRFKDSFKLRQGDKDLYRDLMLKKKKLLGKLENSGRMFKLGDNEVFMVFLDDFKSHITLDYPGFKVYVIISSYGGASIRVRHDVKDAEGFKDRIVEKILKLDNIQNAGGHPNAFGCMLIDNDPHKQVEFAKSLLHIIDEELSKF